MKHNIKILKVASVLLTAGLMSACGSQAYRDTSLGSSSGSINGGGSGWTTTTTIPSGGSGFLPTVSYSFTMNGGSNYTTPAIQTDNKLKVRINPGTAAQSVGSGYTATYSCIQYTITAVGKSVQTAILNVGAGCTQGTSTEQVIDFSDRLTPGHGDVYIKVTAVKTNNRYQMCNINWTYAQQYCGPYAFSQQGMSCCNMFAPVTAIFWNSSLGTGDQVTGSLDIEVNGSTTL